MTEKSFVMVSLKEDKAKKLTQTLSNETCRNILDYLSTRKEATESQISKDLKIPISTVHYNLKQLAENKLITADEFHYSEKGKEVIHYKIANKYIIIAPDEDESFLEKLKSFIPSFIIVGAVTLSLYLFQIITKTGTLKASANMDANINQVLYTTTEETGGAAAKMASASPEAAQAMQTAAQNTDIALWFFIGAIFTMIIFLLWEIYRHTRNKH